MHRRQEQADAMAQTRRAVELGNTGGSAALPDLLALTSHPRASVRRAAASALGKLATAADAQPALPRLAELTRDPHPQVRQYAILALGKLADESALPALRDVLNRPTEPDYNLRSALRAIEQVQAAANAKRLASPAACARCGRHTTPAEREMSERQFQRVYCDACFNAVFIERRNFDAKVQNQKTILTQDRTVVQTQGERCIADWLTDHGIACRYDDKFQIIQGYAVRPDFYLPEFDVYIEYWGLDTTDYEIGMLKKRKLYQQEGKRLISVYPEDLPRLDAVLTQKLSAYGWHHPDSHPPPRRRDERSESSP